MAEPTLPDADHRVITTAGHVDHGKSTLLRALTGMEPDRLDEERRRGLTLDLGYAWVDLDAGDGRRVTAAFVDVPGHERFVATMLAGAGAAPAALLVVAADDGWSRQSAEHRDVLDLLGVPGVATVLTKADTVDEGRIDEVRGQIADELADTSLDTAPVVVTDALTGRGIEELADVVAARLDELPAPQDIGRPRLWVDRSFAVAGAGTVVTGTLSEGWLAVGDEVSLLPSGTRSRLRGLQALGEPVHRAGPGHRVALNLVGVEHTAVARGDVVVAGTPWRVTDVAECWIRAVPGHRVQRTGAWHLHVGSAATPVRLLETAGPLGREAAAAGAVRLVLDEPLPLVAGDRVVLRETGRRAVAAGGVVATPDPPRRPRGRSERTQRAGAVREIAEAGRAGRLVALVELAGGAADAERLYAAVGWPTPAALPDALAAVGHHVVTVERRAAWRTAVRELGPGTHARETVVGLLRGTGASGELASAVVDDLVAHEALVRHSGGFALPEHVDAASEERRHRAEALIARLEESPFAPPDLEDAVREVGMEPRELAVLVQSGEIVRCGKVAFARSAVRRAAEVLGELGAGGRGFTASQAKEAWGTSRRFAIPLLEHLDRTGVTRFDGQYRTLR